MKKSYLHSTKCPDAYGLLFKFYDYFLSRLEKTSNPDVLNCELFYEEMHETAKQLIKSNPNKALIRRSTQNVL
ncbi:MAG: hypothetical protein D6813_08855, partial [Calditrichaeota bacterium]